ncbi:hypothetical protein Micbo1qcDRAFT_24127 [Microdochium bolleyi]|uniref:Uncharacterized protein n=1 Tax=Microdochium bolleyi TaxID=196109 RepID=A0A136JD53_9PEZI|nr:hypothetical protein Micbo1qcDRAFT_24127 [Microdochium bolleyi]
MLQLRTLHKDVGRETHAGTELPRVCPDEQHGPDPVTSSQTASTHPPCSSAPWRSPPSLPFIHLQAQLDKAHLGVPPLVDCALEQVRLGAPHRGHDRDGGLGRNVRLRGSRPHSALGLGRGGGGRRGCGRGRGEERLLSAIDYGILAGALGRCGSRAGATDGGGTAAENGQPGRHGRVAPRDTASGGAVVGLHHRGRGRRHDDGGRRRCHGGDARRRRGDRHHRWDRARGGGRLPPGYRHKGRRDGRCGCRTPYAVVVATVLVEMVVIGIGPGEVVGHGDRRRRDCEQ